MFVDNSKYKRNHDDIVQYVKNMVDVDLNKYRSGNGTSPYTTTYWDINGLKVCIDHTIISKKDICRIRELKNVSIEIGGAWFSYVSIM